MSLLLQQLLVGIAVAACALFSLWRLASLRLRLRLLEALGALPRPLTVPWLARLKGRTRERLAGGCAGCAAAATPEEAAPRNQTPGALRR
jgi:hypothetical protein